MSNFCLNCEKFSISELENGLCRHCNIIKYLKNVKMGEKIDEIEEKRLCLYCNKTLLPIGNTRRNGGSFTCDYKKRKYHKSCFKLCYNASSSLSL